MGRSVSTPSNTEHVVFAYVDYDEDFGQEQFADDIENLRGNLMKAFPSLVEDDRWLDREDHAIARNQWAYFGVSEYCGLLSIWCARRDDIEDKDSGLQARWLGSISKRFHRAANDTYGTLLRHVGTFSNGEACFTPDV